MLGFNRMKAILEHIKYNTLSADIKRKWSFEDYIHNRMQDMSAFQIEQFMTEAELWEAEKKLNNDGFRDIFNSKKSFYQSFSEFMKRQIIFAADVSEEDFIEFVKKYKKVVVKPDDKYAGIGIYILELSQTGKVVYPENCPCFQKLQEQNYVIEQYVWQAKEYAEVYDKCLNTLRITTLINEEGQAEILFAVNQFGSAGSITDNNDDTALWYVVGKTGKVEYCDIDEKTGLVYDYHPDSNYNMSEFKNPCFNKVCQLAIRLAAVVPECRLIGWDIAVTKEYEIELIEGNVTPELYLYQYISGQGLRKKMSH